MALVLGDRQIICAQTAGGAGERVVKKIARFESAGPILDKPEVTGQALREFLATHGLGASKAVVGVPARWVIAQERDLPPVEPAEAIAMLRLQAERLSMGEVGSLAVDTAGDVTAGQSKVLLVGMLRTQLAKIEKLVEAAGLSLAGVCPTALATSFVLGTDHAMLNLADDGAELVQWQGGAARMLRPIGSSTDTAAIAMELKRTLAMRGGGAGELLVCDGIGMADGVADRLLQNVGTNPRGVLTASQLNARIDVGAINGAANGLRSNAYLPAVALALAGVDRRRLPVNLIESRLTAVAPSRFGRPVLLAIGAGVAIVLGVVSLFVTTQAREEEEIALAKQLKDLQPTVKEAQSHIDRIAYGRTYFDVDKRPQYLACARELATASNYDESIWISSITLRSTREGQMQGKSTDQRLILALRDRLMSNKKFAKVQLLDMRESGGRGGEITYSLSFTFNPAGK